MDMLREREVPKSITFFMVVTNRDAHLASYAIKSFHKLAPISKQYEWKLVVFANCLSTTKRLEVFSEWRSWPYVDIIDYAKEQSEINNYQGPYLRAEDCWKYAFRICTTDYLCIVDADFEIFHPQFVFEILRVLEAYPAVGIMSADSSPDLLTYESYSNKMIFAKCRCHTWFCFYKHFVLQLDESVDYHSEDFSGLPVSYDRTAYFQEQCFLKHKVLSLGLSAMTSAYQNDYIHYGAFSKNVTINTPRKVARFRRVAVLAKLGVYWVINPHGRLGRSVFFPNKLLTKFFTRLFTRLYGRSQNERSKVNPVNPLDS